MASKEYLALQFNKAIQLTLQSANITDEEALEVADLYPEWNPDKRVYAQDSIVRYGIDLDGYAMLYRCLQEHTSQADWTPDTSVSLWKVVGFTPSGIPIWVQPLGSMDAYQKGDQVSFNDEIWTSNVDNNVWQPGVYGWDKE